MVLFWNSRSMQAVGLELPKLTGDWLSPEVCHCLSGDCFQCCDIELIDADDWRCWFLGDGWPAAA